MRNIANRSVEYALDFLKGVGGALALTAAAVSDPLKWVQALGFMTDVHWPIEPWARQAIFAALAVGWLFVWYYRTRSKYEAKTYPEFSLDVAAVIAGGQSHDVPPVFSLIVLVLVRNVGLECRGVNGTAVTYGPSDSLLEKTTTPIPVGGMVTGYIGAVSTDADAVRVGPEDQIVIRCVDVMDREHVLVHDCSEGTEGPWQPMHVPGISSQEWRPA